MANTVRRNDTRFAPLRTLSTGSMYTYGGTGNIHMVSSEGHVINLGTGQFFNPLSDGYVEELSEARVTRQCP